MGQILTPGSLVPVSVAFNDTNSGAGSYASIGSALSVTTNVANQMVLLTLNAYATPGTGTLLIAYKLDSDAEVQMTAETSGISGANNISCILPITIASAGSHTIQLRAKSTGTAWSVKGSGDGNASTFSAIPL